MYEGWQSNKIEGSWVSGAVVSPCTAYSQFVREFIFAIVFVFVFFSFSSIYAIVILGL